MIGSIIIIGVAIVSALIRYFQDYSVYKFNPYTKEKYDYTMEVYTRDTFEETPLTNSKTLKSV